MAQGNSLTVSSSEISDPAISNLPSWTTTYAYDAAARLHAVLDPRVSAKPFLYTYDTLASVVAQLAMPTGQTIAYARDAQGRLLSTTLSGTASQTLATHAYTYDLAGQRTTATTTSATTAYTYDALRQLATATETPAGTGQAPTQQFAYAYDPIGNRLTAATVTETTAYTANSVNQYTAIVPGTGLPFAPTYDANGNTTTLPSGLVLDYDEENRLVSAATLTTREEYTYDGLGRRVERRTFTAASGLTVPATTTRYVYDGWRVLEELTSTQSSPFTLQSSYTRGLDLSGTLEGAGGIGGLLAMTRDPAGSATSAYYFHDGNGNVSTLVSASDALVASYTYTPFGDTLTATGTWASVNAYRFSAKECDAFTGLYYYGFRYYNPGAGRWINRDPIQEKGGVNLYWFVGNRPINYRDALGLKLESYSADVSKLKISPVDWYAKPNTLGEHQFDILDFHVGQKTGGCPSGAGAFLEIKGRLDIRLTHLKGKDPESNKGTADGLTINEHERTHAGDSRDIWNEIVNAANKYEGCYCKASCFNAAVRIVNTYVMKAKADIDFRSLKYDIDGYASGDSAARRLFFKSESEAERANADLNSALDEFTRSQCSLP